MRSFRFGFLILSVLAVNAYADAILGSASNFAVLGATTVTNTGSTTLTGDLGVTGTSITDQTQITVDGVSAVTSPFVFINDTTATTANNDATTGFNYLAGLSDTATLGADLTGKTIGVGVYDFAGGAATLNGALTLDFQGKSNAIIVFQMASTLITGSADGASVSLINVGSNDQVYWEVGSSATLGTYTSFVGDIVALTSVTMDTGAIDACGSVIARTGAVTMDTNTVGNDCSVVNSSGTVVGTLGGTVTGTGSVNMPEGGSTFLYLCIYLVPIGALLAFRRRRSI